jgi:hypothetical protein
LAESSAWTSGGDPGGESWWSTGDDNPRTATTLLYFLFFRAGDNEDKTSPLMAVLVFVMDAVAANLRIAILEIEKWTKIMEKSQIERTKYT